MSLYKKTSFARLMSVTALCVGIFLWIYMFCINPAEGTYTPIPEDSLAQQELTSILGASYVPDEIIIKFKPSEVNLKTSLGQMEIKTLAVEENLEKADMITSKNLVLMKIEDDMSVEQKISELQANPDVEYAEPNYIRYALGSLTDYNDTYAHLMT